LYIRIEYKGYIYIYIYIKTELGIEGCREPKRSI